MRRSSSTQIRGDDAAVEFIRQFNSLSPTLSSLTLKVCIFLSFICHNFFSFILSFTFLLGKFLEIGEQSILEMARLMDENPPNIHGLWLSQKLLPQSLFSTKLSESTILTLFNSLSSNQYLKVFQIAASMGEFDFAQLWDGLSNNYALEYLWLFNRDKAKGERFGKICSRNWYYKDQQRFKTVKAVLNNA